MRKEYVVYAIDKIKELLPDFEKKALEANYGTDAWKEIKKIVVDMCEERKIVYINKDDLVKDAIQSLRLSIREAKEKKETTQEHGVKKTIPEEKDNTHAPADDSHEFRLEPSPVSLKKSHTEDQRISPQKESDSLPLFPDENKNDSPKDPGFPNKSFR